MKYNFKGTITKYDDNGKIISEYSYYANEKMINIIILEKILERIENEKHKSLIRKIEKIKKLEKKLNK